MFVKQKILRKSPKKMKIAWQPSQKKEEVGAMLKLIKVEMEFSE